MSRCDVRLARPTVQSCFQLLALPVRRMDVPDAVDQ